MLVVHIHVHVKPECLEAFKEASLANARASLQEPGVVRFDVVQQQDDPTRFVFVEVYTDENAAAAHKATAHYPVWRDTVASMMAEPRTGLKYSNIHPGRQKLAMNFEFATARRIIFGAGLLRELGPYAKGQVKRALVVTGKDGTRAEPLLMALKENGIDWVTFSVAGEPELATVEKGTALAKSESCDAVFAMGGGSVIDAGKAIAAMMTNDGELLDYVEIIGRGKSLAKPPAPFIAIPTTAGTGAEVTRNAVLASPEHQLKVSLRSPLMLPSVALVDPELTYHLPPALTASTGMDALTQLIEPYVCTRANPMTDGFCAEGIRRAARSLRTAYGEGNNHAAREDMAAAGLLGGLSLANAGLGAVHGFAGPIGGSFPAPHGSICAALLPQVMAMNICALRQRDPHNPALGRYYRVAHLLTEENNSTADVGVEWVRRLVADLNLPRLGRFGITPEHIPDLVAKAQNASSMKANPIVLTAEELAEVLRQAI